MEVTPEHSILECSDENCEQCLRLLEEMNIHLEKTGFFLNTSLRPDISGTSKPAHIPWDWFTFKYRLCMFLYKAKRCICSRHYRKKHEAQARFHGDIHTIIDKYGLSTLKLPGSIYEWYFLGFDMDLWFINIGDPLPAAAILTRIPRTSELYKCVLGYNEIELSEEFLATPEDLTRMELRVGSDNINNSK